MTSMRTLEILLGWNTIPILFVLFHKLIATVGFQIQSCSSSSRKVRHGLPNRSSTEAGMIVVEVSSMLWVLAASAMLNCQSILCSDYVDKRALNY